MYPYYNTGLKHTFETSSKTETFPSTWAGLEGKPNKGVLIANKGGATQTRTFVLPSNPTGNMPGDEITVKIPAKTVVVLPIRIYSVAAGTSQTGAATCKMILLQ
tara:strand:+ start:711 stop:1022 length:312 start_codon:yes stop_codon:yes gene_type:complete